MCVWTSKVSSKRIWLSVNYFTWDANLKKNQLDTLARDRATQMRLLNLRKPMLSSELLRTRERRTMSLSSPWKLSTELILTPFNPFFDINFPNKRICWWKWNSMPLLIHVMDIIHVIVNLQLIISIMSVCFSHRSSHVLKSFNLKFTSWDKCLH